ncbi:MAG: amidohydrolase family protein [Bacteroidia bacterium]
MWGLGLVLGISILWAQKVFIQGATLHTAKGRAYVGDILIQGDTIAALGEKLTPPQDAKILSATGLHAYPGLIALGTHVGLVEIQAVRATRDLGENPPLTPELEAIYAYNVDSRVIPTLRYNGVLYAEVTPAGEGIMGRSSVVRLSGKTWQEAQVHSPALLHVAISLPEKKTDPAQDKLRDLEKLFDQAKAYLAQKPTKKDIRLEALMPYLKGEKPVAFHANTVDEILYAVALMRRYQVKGVIYGGLEAHKVAALLREAQIPVVLFETHRLPPEEDAPIHWTYQYPKILQDSGIKVALAVPGFWQVRNLAYQAGTAATWGLTDPEALALITRTPAEILNLPQLGTLEVGKKASLLLVEGDLIDVPTSQIRYLFLEGKSIDPHDNPQYHLYQKYRP